MQQFIQSVKSFVAWEWIGHVTKSLFKLASYIVELPMVASGVYIMIATGIPGANNPHWYNLAFGVLLSAPEVLAPGAFFRAESMQSRGKLKVARVTRWIAGFMLFFAALTFSSVMIFHFSNEWLQAIMFCRVMTALGYSIITRIDMDHGAMPVQPPALPVIDVQKQIDEAIEKAKSDHAQELATLKTQIEEVKTATHATLQTLPETLKTEEIIETVVARLSQQLEVFLNERVSVSPVIETPQISAPQSVSGHVSTQSETPSENIQPPALKQPRRPTKTSNAEIVRRSRKVSDEEVDAVVHPILDKDRNLTHRKIAPVIGLPETTVYKSLKRWRDNQPVVSGEVETADSDTAM